MTAESLLFSLLRFVVCEEKIDNEIKDFCKQELLEELYALSSKHDLAHLAGYALEKLELPETEILAKFKTAKMRAIYRYLRQDHEANRMYGILEEERIPFIPLKGAVLRGYYPQPWMRTSCDIDILVPESMLARAESALTEKLGYIVKGEDDYNVSMFSANGVHLELHYLAMRRGRFPKAQTVLDGIWDGVEKTETSVFQKILTDEMFYFFHIVHMAKHIENGGCGIRSFLDLWILNHKIIFDVKKRNGLLLESDLLTFNVAVERLSDIWFSQKETDPMSQGLEEYILHGGTFGSLTNKISVYQHKLSGKCRYVFKEIFLPYDQLKYCYPVLTKYRILTPIFECVRWFRLLFNGGIKRLTRELKVVNSLSDETRDETQTMLQYLGLEQT